MIDSGKKISSFILGVIILALGLIPILEGFGVIGFKLPMAGLFMALKVASAIFAVGGVFILVDAHLEDHTLKVPSTIIGIILMGLGVFGLLSAFGVIPFGIPFMSAMVVNSLYTIEGLFLVIAAFAV